MKIGYLVDLIVDNIEGGYYHPDMKPKLINGDRMGISGETMFGLDRTHGGSMNTGDAGLAFWQLVDANYGTHHGETKYYNDKADGRLIPASVGTSLKNYLTQIMSAQLQKNAAMLSEGARKIVFNNPALTLQFLYACWNGSGNFKLFADVLNAAYANGQKSAEAYWNLIQAARRQKGGLIAEGADKLDKLKDKVGGSSGAGWIVPAVVGGLLLWWLLKKK